MKLIKWWHGFSYFGFAFFWGESGHQMIAFTRSPGVITCSFGYHTKVIGARRR